jgi:hypothetical protein
MLRYAPANVSKVSISSISFSGAHVTDDLTAIKSYPVEGSVWEFIDVIPAELLSEKSRHTSKATKLGKLT